MSRITDSLVTDLHRRHRSSQDISSHRDFLGRSLTIPSFLNLGIEIGRINSEISVASSSIPGFLKLFLIKVPSSRVPVIRILDCFAGSNFKKFSQSS